MQNYTMYVQVDKINSAFRALIVVWLVAATKRPIHDSRAVSARSHGAQLHRDASHSQTLWDDGSPRPPLVFRHSTLKFTKPRLGQCLLQGFDGASRGHTSWAFFASSTSERAGSKSTSLFALDTSFSRSPAKRPQRHTLAKAEATSDCRVASCRRSTGFPRKMSRLVISQQKSLIPRATTATHCPSGTRSQISIHRPPSRKLRFIPPYHERPVGVRPSQVVSAIPIAFYPPTARALYPFSVLTHQ